MGEQGIKVTKFDPKTLANSTTHNMLPTDMSDDDKAVTVGASIVFNNNITQESSFTRTALEKRNPVIKRHEIEKIK